MFKKRLLFVVSFVLINLLMNFQVVSALDSEIDIKTKITLSETYGASVSQEITIRARKDMPANLNIPAFGTNLQQLKAKAAGKQTTITEENGRLNVLVAQAVANTPRTFNVDITYTANIGVRFGNSFIIMVPASDYGDLGVGTESIVISSPIELGTPIPRALKPTTSSFSIGNQVSTWTSKDGPLNQSVGLLFGDNAIAKATFSHTLQNDTFWWQRKSFVIPPDTNQQKIFIESISPQPSKVSLDEDGNTIVEYLIGPKQNVNVSAEVAIAVNSYTYSLDSVLKVNDIEQELRDRYTGLNDVWRDTEVEIPGAESLSVSELVGEIYREIAKEYKNVNSTQWFEASQERSDALIGELRANGIPARLVLGAVFGDGTDVFPTPILHTWVEVYIPAIGWVTLDPTFEQAGDFYGVTDIQRVAFVLRGFDPYYPPENLAQYSISYSNEETLPEVASKPTISATKYMLLPGLSLDSIAVTMPAGYIIDYTQLNRGNQVFSLGSLSPFQTVKLRSFSVLGKAFSTENLQFTVPDLDGNDVVLAEATTVISYMPFILFIVGLALLFGVWILFTKLFSYLHDRRSERNDRKRREKVIETAEEYAALDIPDETEESQEIPIQSQSQLANQSPQAQPPQVNVNNAGSVSPHQIQEEIRKKRPPLIQ